MASLGALLGLRKITLCSVLRWFYSLSAKPTDQWALSLVNGSICSLHRVQASMTSGSNALACLIRAMTFVTMACSIIYSCSTLYTHSLSSWKIELWTPKNFAYGNHDNRTAQEKEGSAGAEMWSGEGSLVRVRGGALITGKSGRKHCIVQSRNAAIDVILPPTLWKAAVHCSSNGALSPVNTDVLKNKLILQWLRQHLLYECSRGFLVYQDSWAHTKEENDILASRWSRSPSGFVLYPGTNGGFDFRCIPNEVLHAGS